MSTRPRRPLRRRLQARAMRVVNVPMRRALALPFATPLSSRLMLVFLTGRRTGRSYRQPLSYVRQGDTLLTPGGGTWKRNLVEGGAVRIRLRGQDVLAVPELVGDYPSSLQGFHHYPPCFAQKQRYTTMKKIMLRICAAVLGSVKSMGISRSSDSMSRPAATMLSLSQ